MTILLVIAAVTLLVTIAATSKSSAPARDAYLSGVTRNVAMSSRVAGVERCLSARLAAPYYRVATWAWQTKRYGDLADRTPIVRGKSCHWSRYAAREHNARAVSAHKSFTRWWKERGTVIDRLNRGLAGTPMGGTGAILERYGRIHHVSPYFMAAVAATESSLGVAACSNNRFNVWGLASCNQSWYVPSFRSWSEAIAFYARFLSGRWPGHSNPYSFRGYAACSDCWGRKTSYWMRSLFGVAPATRYP